MCSVITGCTDGIGREYALELARRGFNKFLLIGRNASKLDDVARALRVERPTAVVETHVFDFESDAWDKLPVEKLASYEIGMLGRRMGAMRTNVVCSL
jgi:short-subunit dehydrogenase